MLTAVIRIALALEILLVCVEGVVPAAHDYLPLGRSHLAQLGLVASNPADHSAPQTSACLSHSGRSVRWLMTAITVVSGGAIARTGCR